MKNFTNLILALIITLTPVIILVIPIVISLNKTGNNTYLLDKNYSHLNKNQVVEKLHQDFVLPQNLNLSLSDKNYQLSLASASASINYEKTTNSLLFRRLNEGIFPYLKNLFGRQNFNLTIDYDSNFLDQQISLIKNEVDQPFIPTEIILKSSKVIITSGSQGLELDQQLLKDNIISNLTSGNFDETINLTLNPVGYIPDTSTLELIKTKAQKFIGKNITLSLDDNKTVINDSTLISWLNFETEFKDQKIIEYIADLAISLDHPPIDAVFKFENNKVLEFQPAKDGVVVNQEELKNLILQSIPKLIDSSDKTIDITIPISNAKPKINNSDVNDLGIKELIGKGTSSFRHSSNTRNENIAKGTSIVNRILVAPGDTFSFIKSLGEVSLEAGYKKAYIIRNGKTELDVGGGICQVSTTLFRAMLDAGLNIVQRQAHAYRVSYYEEDSKPGFDATVFIPSPDLQFINDTGHYVLVQNTLDMTNRRLTYEIYGTSDGRKSEITNYRQWDYTAAPPDIWIDDPTLPVGKTIQDEHAIPGLKTSFDWTVTKDGQILHKKTFTSNYVPWAAVYRRGTGN